MTEPADRWSTDPRRDQKRFRRLDPEGYFLGIPFEYYAASGMPGGIIRRGLSDWRVTERIGVCCAALMSLLPFPEERRGFSDGSAVRLWLDHDKGFSSVILLRMDTPRYSNIAIARHLIQYLENQKFPVEVCHSLFKPARLELLRGVNHE